MYGLGLPKYFQSILRNFLAFLQNMRKQISIFQDQGGFYQQAFEELHQPRNCSKNPMFFQLYLALLLIPQLQLHTYYFNHVQLDDQLRNEQFSFSFFRGTLIQGVHMKPQHNKQHHYEINHLVSTHNPHRNCNSYQYKLQLYQYRLKKNHRIICIWKELNKQILNHILWNFRNLKKNHLAFDVFQQNRGLISYRFSLAHLEFLDSSRRSTQKQYALFDIQIGYLVWSIMQKKQNYHSIAASSRYIKLAFILTPALLGQIISRVCVVPLQKRTTS